VDLIEARVVFPPSRQFKFSASASLFSDEVVDLERMRAVLFFSIAVLALVLLMAVLKRSSSAPRATISAIPFPAPTAMLAAASQTPTASPNVPQPEASSTPTAQPLKSRIVVHHPEQFGKISTAELAVIKKALRTIRWSRNGDPGAAADEDYAAIVKYFKDGTPHNLFADLIAEIEGNDYRLGDGAANDTYSLRVQADFDSSVKADRDREEAAAGPAPDTDTLWGVSLYVHDAIKSVLRDPDSYKYISVSGPWRTSHTGKPCWLEKVHFRAKNGFGGYEIDTASVWVVRDSTSYHETVLDVQLASQE